MNDLEALRKQYTAPDLATASAEELRAYAERLEQGVIDVVRVKNTMSEALTLEQERRAAAGTDVFLVVIRDTDVYYPIGIFTDQEIVFSHARRIAATFGPTYEGVTHCALAIFKEQSKADGPDIYVQAFALNDTLHIKQAMHPPSRYIRMSEVTK